MDPENDPRLLNSVMWALVVLILGLALIIGWVIRG